jgi:hypothetical protein
LDELPLPEVVVVIPAIVMWSASQQNASDLHAGLLPLPSSRRSLTSDGLAAAWRNGEPLMVLSDLRPLQPTS